MKPTNDFSDLVAIVKILRKECPWDRKQTHESIKDNLIEEAYEAIEAIDRGDYEELKKELGDLLLHVLFHSRIAAEKNGFTIADVIYAIQEKLIRRHPHVFADTEVKDEQQVAENWESIKMKEGKESVLDGIPSRLPALIHAQRMQEKASNVGFDWERSPDGEQQIWDKLEEELSEFKEALQQNDLKKSKEEYGDFLFSLVNIGRFLGLNSEDSVRLANRKFESRFRFVEKEIARKNKSPKEVSLKEMDRYWEQAKEAES